MVSTSIFKSLLRDGRLSGSESPGFPEHFKPDVKLSGRVGTSSFGDAAGHHHFFEDVVNATDEAGAIINLEVSGKVNEDAAVDESLA